MSKVNREDAPAGAMYWRPTPRQWVRKIGNDWQYYDREGRWLRYHPTMVPSLFVLTAKPDLPNPEALLRNGPTIMELLRKEAGCDCCHDGHCDLWGLDQDAAADLLRELGVKR